MKGTGIQVVEEDYRGLNLIYFPCCKTTRERTNFPCERKVMSLRYSSYPLSQL